MNADDIRKLTGGYISATPLQNVPGVRAAFDELIARVQALPFVPADWSANVRAAMSQSGEAYPWQPAPAIRLDAWRADKDEPVYPESPAWLVNNPQARRAWNTLCDWWGDRLQPILAGWARDEAATLRAAYDDAAFWNTLYALVRPVAVVGQTILDAPGVVADTANRIGLDMLKKLWPLLAVGAVIAVGVLVYKRKLSGK